MAGGPLVSLRAAQHRSRRWHRRDNAVTLALNDTSFVTPPNVTVQVVRHAGSDALEIRQTGPLKGCDPDTFACISGLDFHDGTIEVDVSGSPPPSGLPAARSR
jgi:hypothetical protein